MFFHTFLPKLLNMSLTASAAIVFVLLLRLLLKRAPKVLSYALWGIVLFRLLCPVSIASSFSIFGLLDVPAKESGSLTGSISYVPGNAVQTDYPTVVPPVPGVGDMAEPVLSQAPELPVAEPTKAPIPLAAYVWMAGVLGMGIYAAVSYGQLRRKIFTAIHLRENIWSADGITTPFVMGLFRPKIYLPASMEERELTYILLHEQHHIRRLDHIAKALAFVALCIHWFNPLVWVAFLMAGKDMEMSCDEAVVKKIGEGVLADYTASLLSLATGRHIIAGMPLAFGEGDTKGRIRNLANWKKPAFWVVLVAVIACAVLAVCLLTDPSAKDDPPSPGDSSTGATDATGEPEPASSSTAPEETAPASEVLEWFDFTDNPSSMYLYPALYVNLPEFPDATFQYSGSITVSDGNSSEPRTIIVGMPIWNAYFCDLTGDGLPEVCCTVSIGSGMIDDRVIIYDYANGVSYELQDRSFHDYVLRLNNEDGALYVDKSDYFSSDFLTSGRLVWIDGCITVQFSNSESKTVPPRDIVATNGAILAVNTYGIQTPPYIHMLWSERWNHGEWLSGDGTNLLDELPQIHDQLPQIIYQPQDFEICYREGVSLQSISIYDSAFARIHKNASLSILSELESGTYYLGVVVKSQGKFIEEENQYETTGYECVYKVIIE